MSLIKLAVRQVQTIVMSTRSCRVTRQQAYFTRNALPADVEIRGAYEIWTCSSLNGMKFSGAPSAEHESINRVHVGVVHGALGKELHEWRAPQVADYCKLKGSGRFAPGQTQEGALADMTRELTALEQRFPGLKTSIRIEKKEGHQSMPAFEVAKDARIVKVINAAYETVRGEKQPTGAITPPGFFGTDGGHLYAEAGMEGIVCGPGGRYNTMPDERVEIRDFLDMVRIYILTILEICEVA